MLGEVWLAVAPPSGIVAPLGGCATVPVVLASGLIEMRLTVAGLVGGEVGAAGISAGSLRFPGHGYLSFREATTRGSPRYR